MTEKELQDALAKIKYEMFKATFYAIDKYVDNYLKDIISKASEVKENED